MTREELYKLIRDEHSRQYTDDLMYDIDEYAEQIRTEVIAEISREIRLLYGNEYEKQIRAEVIKEINAIMDMDLPISNILYELNKWLKEQK